MKVEKHMKNKRWVVTIDGDRYTLPEAARKLCIPENHLDYSCRKFKKGDEFGTHMDEVAWKAGRNIPLGEKIYTIDGHRVTTTLVMRASGCGVATASNRLADAANGKKTYAELLKPVSAAAAARGRKNIKLNHVPKKIPGMQPRRSIRTIHLGTWEQQQLKNERERGWVR